MTIVFRILNLFREHIATQFPILLPVRGMAFKSLFLLATVLPLATLLSVSTVTAEIKNGSFETSGNNFADSWEKTSGLVNRLTQGHGIRPTDGSYMIRLGTWDDYGLNNAADLESFLNLPPGGLNGLGNGTMRNGNAIRQEIKASPGDTVVFEWDFLTAENRDSTPALDFAFVSVVCPGETHLEELVDTSISASTSAPVFLLATDGSYFDAGSDHTGYRSFSITLASGGVCRLGVGIAQQQNSGGYSEIFVDNFKLTPDPSALSKCESTLSRCETILVESNVDADLDGVVDLEDQCLGTTYGSEVDDLGCSLVQFCSNIVISSKKNYLTCFFADWKDDERFLARDCKVDDGICQPR
jgi:hypothetical protein